MTLRRFCAIHYVVMLTWVAFIIGAILVSNALSVHIENRVLQWAAPKAVLAGAVVGGYLARQWLFNRLDPDGSLRAVMWD